MFLAQSARMLVVVTIRMVVADSDAAPPEAIEHAARAMSNASRERLALTRIAKRLLGLSIITCQAPFD